MLIEEVEELQTIRSKLDNLEFNLPDYQEAQILIRVASDILEKASIVIMKRFPINQLLSEISVAIGKEDFAQANLKLNDLSFRLGENNEEVIRMRTFIDFLYSDLK